jgi:hypothetical protein
MTKENEEGKKNENIGKEYNKGGKDDELPEVNHEHKRVKRTMGGK